MISFRRIQYTPLWAMRLTPLLQLNHQETPLIPGAELDPDWDGYWCLSLAGKLRIYVAEDGDQLVGYQAYILSPHGNYKKTKVASCEVIFMLPSHRGHAVSFLSWAEAALARDGAEFIYHENPTGKRFDVILRRRGYGPVTTRWGKKITGTEK